MTEPQRSNITFNAYLAACAETPNSQRHGQWAYNVLAMERPDLTEELPEMYDPFYSDAVLPEFYQWLERNWHNG